MKPKNLWKEYLQTDIQKFKKLVKENTPTPLIAYDMWRTEWGIRKLAHNMGISLKPTNKSPYGTKKK